MIIEKTIVKIGNSAGVILPREWLNGKARVQLVKKPINIKKEVLEILEPYFEDIIGIYLVGSYARGEETEKSDIDLLVITYQTTKTLTKRKYNIMMLSQKNIENSLKNNAVIFLPMIKEAKPLINKYLIELYKNTPLTKKNLEGYIKIANSSLKINKKFIESAKKTSSPVSDAVAYSLILNLRSVYFVDCIKDNTKWSNKELFNLIKRISGSLNAYEGYLRIKENKNMQENLPNEEALKIYSYLDRKIKEHEKWLKAKKE
ncbi:MAG: nucleotidyltransferase domain-containing protein [Nanoarchaeota archaeon]